jgi:hypothetical protein
MSHSGNWKDAQCWDNRKSEKCQSFPGLKNDLGMFPSKTWTHMSPNYCDIKPNYNNDVQWSLSSTSQVLTLYDESWSSTLSLHSECGGEVWAPRLCLSLPCSLWKSEEQISRWC